MKGTRKAVHYFAMILILVALTIIGYVDDGLAETNSSQGDSGPIDVAGPDGVPVPGSVMSGMLVGPDSILTSARAVPDQYIVQLEDVAVTPGAVRSPLFLSDDVNQATGLLLGRHGIRAEVRYVYKNALKGFTARMTREQARELVSDPRVRVVEQDGVVYATKTQMNAPWGLDRIDQSGLPLNGTYTYLGDGSGVQAYIVDTGVLTFHEEFSGRVGNGFDAINDENGDGNGGIFSTCEGGHGTHVAGTIGGSTYGVAKEVTLHSVRVLNCGGSGTWGGVIAGIDWVAANHISPAVANMSLGGSASDSLDIAVQNSIKAGVSFAVAAGNDNDDACGNSPARVDTALTVGSTSKRDKRSYFSCFGPCVDVFAPGSGILSAFSRSATDTKSLSGTSMASPHVAGVVALYLQSNPSATPAQVFKAVIDGAVPGLLSDVGKGSPNLLLKSNIGGMPPPSACGDGYCSGDEACNSCPADCSICCEPLQATGLSGGYNTEHRFTITGTDVTVQTQGQSGSYAHLYIKLGSPPVRDVNNPENNDWDCVSANYDANENCSVDGTGTFHILVWGNGAHTGVELYGVVAMCLGSGGGDSGSVARGELLKP